MKNSMMRRFGMAFVIAMMAGGLAACEEEGPAEQAGEEHGRVAEGDGDDVGGEPEVAVQDSPHHLERVSCQ